MARFPPIEVFAYKRFIDDINVALESIATNITYDPVLKSLGPCEVEEEENKDKHTFGVLQRIADSVTSMVSDNRDNCVPCLDIKISKHVEDTDNKIKFQFYKKPVARQSLISKDSALPTSSKFSI